MRPHIKRIYMVWRAGRSHRRIVVGEIKSNASSTTFRYIKDGVEEAKCAGFICYPDFPDTNKVYNTNILRILSQRLNNAERTDIADYYDFWQISKKETDSVLRVLSHTGGILPTDNFEFLADFYGAKGLSLVTELTGLSNNPLANDSIIEGDILDWRYEPANEYDKYAVAVYKNDKKLGYIKKIHSHVFYRKGSSRLCLAVKLIEHNGHINKAFLSVDYL